MDRVGVIGLGKMGLPIARNLMVRGLHVTGYRRSGSPELLREGGEVAASAAEVAAEADVILSIVPTADDVEEIIAGPAGTLVNLKPGTIHIEMSTIDVDRKARLRDLVQARGGDLLDCPISGSPPATKLHAVSRSHPLEPSRQTAYSLRYQATAARRQRWTEWA